VIANGFAGSNLTGAGLTGSDGNTTRLIDTGLLNAANNQCLGAELFFVRGPLSITAEGTYSYIEGYRLPAGVAGGQVLAGERNFYGYYVTASYFLTGENRTYDRRLGKLAPFYHSGVRSPFFAVKDDNGKPNFGWGAWEIAARYAFVNLDDKN